MCKMLKDMRKMAKFIQYFAYFYNCDAPNITLRFIKILMRGVSLNNYC